MIDAEPRYWTPRIFAVGDRVRICLSPECRTQFIGRSQKSREVIYRRTPHPPEIDGAVGTIDAEDPESKSGHCWLVRFAPAPYASSVGWEIREGIFAASELELLEAER